MPELDSQVKTLLEKIAQQSAKQPQPDHPLSLSEQTIAAREGYRATIGLGGQPEPVDSVLDIEIPGRGGQLKARLYRPASPTKLPILVFYHGGGFNTGDLDTHDRLVRVLANAVPCIVLVVAYRLAPEHPYPAAVEDAWAALQYAAMHGEELGGDTFELAVAGDSAGGNLAAVMARRAALEGKPSLALQVILYGNTDATMSSASWKEFGDKGWILTREQMSAWFKAYLPEGVHPEPGTVSLMDTPVPDGLAPAFIVTGECDPLRDEGEQYAKMLQDAGIRVHQVRFSGMVHGFAQMAGVLDAGRQVLAETALALRTAWSDVPDFDVPDFDVPDFKERLT